MNISLAPETERLIQQQVDSGRYHSANEVVLEAMRLLNEQGQAQKAEIEEMKTKIAAGLRELDEGKGIPFTHELIEEIKSSGRARVTAQQRNIGS
jgi:antitoxin ParD1/3/4